MPTEKGDKRSLSIWLKEDLIERLDLLSGKTEANRSKMATDLIDEGLKQIEGADKLGFLQLAIAIRDLRDWVTKAEKEEKQEGKPLTLWVKKDLIKRLKVMGDKVGLSKSKLAANIVLIGVEDKELNKALADIAYAKALKKWGDRLWSKFKKGMVKQGLTIE